MDTRNATHGPEATGSTVFGMFPGRREAQAAVHALERAGFERGRISVAMRHHHELHPLDAGGEALHESADGAAAGAVGGGVVGGTVGLLAGLGVIAIPGLGPVLAAGWLSSTLVGAGVGAAAGGLLGGLMDMGVPEEDARRFEDNFREGGVLVAVESGGRAAEAAALLRSSSADVSSPRASETTGTVAAGRAMTADDLNPHGDKLGFTGPDRRRRTAVGSYTGPERRQTRV